MLKPRSYFLFILYAVFRVQACDNGSRSTEAKGIHAAGRPFTDELLCCTQITFSRKAFGFL